MPQLTPLENISQNNKKKKVKGNQLDLISRIQCHVCDILKEAFWALELDKADGREKKTTALILHAE